MVMHEARAAKPIAPRRKGLGETGIGRPDFGVARPAGRARRHSHQRVVVMHFLFLYGPPGVGKSTVGRHAAQALDLPFVDLDARIARAAGRSIADIFASEGEAAFRQREAAALRDLIRHPPGPRGAVVALGGGALLDPANRRLAHQAGIVALLTARVETLRDRLAAQPGQRPLLQDATQLTALLQARAAHYASFARQVPTDGQSPDALVWQVQVAWGAFRLRGMGPEYDVRVRPGWARQWDAALRPWLTPSPTAVGVVTDRHVHQYHAAALLRGLDRLPIDLSVHVLRPGEASKTLGPLADLWETWAAAGLDRHSLILALGGGVVGDLAGFAAATYMRGVPWLNLPTSLLAMVDAAVGGKTGIDLPAGKNLVGAFHPPRAVLADPELLRTLPTAHWRYGLAEVLKHALLDGDTALLTLLEQGLDAVRRAADEVVRRAVAIKVAVVQRDPYERAGLRAQLNAGHTVAHAIEAALDYTYPHGAAVAIGLVVEAALAAALGLAPREWPYQVAAWAHGLGLPTRIPAEVGWAAFYRALQHDKKRRGRQVLFALPVAVGQVQPGVTVPEAALHDAWEAWHD